MTGAWALRIPGLLLLVAMAGLALLGIHMMLRPQGYVGRGPIPSRDAGNVRAMGMLFAILGGAITVFFTAPIFLI